jgi:hypothetical protein
MINNKTISKNSFNTGCGNYYITGIAIALVLFHLFSYSREIVATIQPYRIGDWLINYQGGIVRRGFIGQLIYLISTNKLNTIWVTYVIQAIIYLVLTYFVLRLFFAQQRSRVFLLFLFSPAFIFLFPLYDLEGWFRKELLVFLAYAFMVYGLREGVVRVKYLWASFVTFAIAVFSHEIASLTLVFFLFPLYIVYKHQSIPNKKIILFGAAYVLVAIGGLALSVLFPGDLKTAERICISLINRGLQPDICDGAIQYLSYGASHGLNEVMTKIQSRYYFLIYPLLLALALLPIFLTDWWRTRWPILVLGFISLIPLFAVGMDWGRWIVIFATLVLMSVMFDGTLRPLNTRKISLTAVILYAVLWSIPHIQGWPTRLVETYAGSGPGLGVVDLIFAKVPNEITRSPLQNPIWVELGKRYQGFVYYPLRIQSKDQDVFYYFDLKNLITSNLSSSKNWNEEFIQQENARNLALIRSGRLSGNHFYILDQEAALLALQYANAQNDALLKLDGYYVYAPGWKACAECKQISNADELISSTSKSVLDTPLAFSSAKGRKTLLLFEGWSSYSEDWGTWSEGAEAIIKLPLPKDRPKVLELDMAAFLPGKQSTRTVDFFINQEFIKKAILSDSHSNIIKLKIPNSALDQEILILKLMIENPLSPYELGISLDRRKLGIGIKSAIFR